MIDFTDPTAIKDYFEALATSHVDIDTFVYGDSDVMQSKAKSEDFGTVLWLDYAQPVQLIDKLSDDIEGKIPNTLFILKKAASEVWEDEETAQGETEIIVRDIMSKLYQDNQAGTISTELAGYKYGESEMMIGAVKFCGTRLDFNLIRSEKLIYNQAKWQ